MSSLQIRLLRYRFGLSAEQAATMAALIWGCEI